MKQSAGSIGPHARAFEEAFYQWELPQRGWLVSDQPVDLEPSFRRCVFKIKRPSVADDARKVGLFRRLAGFRQSPDEPNTSADQILLAPARTDFLRGFLRVSFPEDCRASKETMLRFLTSIGRPGAPIAFEYIGRAGKLRYQLAIPEPDLQPVETALRAFAPAASVFQSQDLLDDWPVEQFFDIFDFGLAREFLLPLSVPAFELHPLTGTLAALGEAGPGEVAVLQILAQPVRSPWAAEMSRAVRGPSGDGLFADAPEMTRQCALKTAHPLFAVAVRVAVSGHNTTRVRTIIRSAAAGFHHLAEQCGNALVPLSNGDYPSTRDTLDVRTRSTRRGGMILNSEELACLTHYPDCSLELPAVDRDRRLSKPLPEHLRNRTGLLLGENRHRGSVWPVRLTAEEQTRHVHLIGATGEGKSNLIATMALQIIEAGQGLALIDPHGDLVRDVAGRMPASRLSDVTYLDPSDQRGLVPMNILPSASGAERAVLVDDIVSVFRRYVTNFGEQMAALLAAGVATVLDGIDGATLLDLRRVLVDSEARDRALVHSRDAETLFYWRKIFPTTGTRAVAPLLARLETFLRPRSVRAIVAGQGPGIDIPALLEGGILLARLPLGSLGEYNTEILGSLLVMKIAHAALARQEREISERKLFALLLDESHCFGSSSMARLFTSGRKSRVGLVASHQSLEQWRHAPDIGDALLSNAFTRIAFRLGTRDAGKFNDEMPGFSPTDFANLRVGETIVRIGNARSAFTMQTTLLPSVANEALTAARDGTIQASATRYRLDAQEITRPDDGVDRQVHTRCKAKPARPQPAWPERSEPVIPSSAHDERGGLGGPQHRYLQHFIRRLGEDRGFRAVVEESIPQGRIDVALYSDALRIACQIAITSNPAVEAGNVAKCLAAQFTNVIVITTDERKRHALEKAYDSQLLPENTGRVLFIAADKIVDTLDSLVPAHKETVRGYKLKVRRRIVADNVDQRKRIIEKIVAQTMRKTGE